MKKWEIKNYVSKVLAHKRHIGAYGDVNGYAVAIDSAVHLKLLLPVCISTCDFGLVIISMFTSGNILSVTLQGIRKTKIFLISSSAALFSDFILSVFLIPKYQMIGASIGYSSITVVSFLIMYYYARKFEILKLEVAKMAKICASGFVMFFVIVVLQSMFSYSPLKLLGYIVLGFAIYSGMIKVMKTFNKGDLEFIMLLIPWWLQKVRKIISALFR